MPQRKRPRRTKVTLAHLHADIHRFNVGDIKCFSTSTIGERGQVVVPSEVRKLMRLKPGAKLAVFVRHNDILCMVKADAIESVLVTLTNQFRGIINPLRALRRAQTRLTK